MERTYFEAIRSATKFKTPSARGSADKREDCNLCKHLRSRRNSQTVPRLCTTTELAVSCPLYDCVAGPSRHQDDATCPQRSTYGLFRIDPGPNTDLVRRR